MTTSAPARWPIPDDVSSLTDPDALFVAKVEAVVLQARNDFARTVGLDDGTRAAQIVAWAREFEAVAS